MAGPSAFSDGPERLARLLTCYQGGRDTRFIDVDHVLAWSYQFDAETRLALVDEVHHVLARTYFGRDRVAHIFGHLCANGVPSGDGLIPISSVQLLDLFETGHSQRDLLDIVEQRMRSTGQTRNTERSNVRYLHLDDFLLSGTRASVDLKSWVESPHCPTSATVHMVFLAVHHRGVLRAARHIEEAAVRAGKRVRLDWAAVLTLEDRPQLADRFCDPLRPARDPSTDAGLNARAYRTPWATSKAGLYSSESRRSLLEDNLLRAGEYICRSLLEKPRHYVRPLGLQGGQSFGFGTMLASYRNCPNHAPLALWFGQPQDVGWTPLLPRRSDQQRENLSFIDDDAFEDRLELGRLPAIHAMTDAS